MDMLQLRATLAQHLRQHQRHRFAARQQAFAIRFWQQFDQVIPDKGHAALRC